MLIETLLAIEEKKSTYIVVLTTQTSNSNYGLCDFIVFLKNYKN